MQVKAMACILQHSERMVSNDIVVDVSVLVPRERHPRVFAAWNSLAAGEAMVLVNDHDPVPLYYQFSVEHRGGFRWEYLQQGPDFWRVRISKGTYADPGFTPGLPAPVRKSEPAQAAEAAMLDVRPVLARGGSPCGLIDEAVAGLAPGQRLVLLAPFEPKPLFGKLGALGFSHHSEAMPDGCWRVEFTPKAN